MRAIPDRVAGRVPADREIETDDSTPRADLGKRHALQLTSLETRELLMRSRACGRDLPKTEAGPHARQVVLLSEAAEGIPRASAPSIRWSFACWHRWHHPIRALPAIYCRSPRPGPPAGPTDERDPGIGPNRPAPPSRWSASRTN